MVEVLIVGATPGSPPGLPEDSSGARYTFADDVASVRGCLPDAEVIFHYKDRTRSLEAAWTTAGRLRWIHVGAAGVDWAMFPQLVESDVTVTNSRGVFDVTMPEYALTLMLALAKDLSGTLGAQQRREWDYRLLQPLAGGRVLIVGAGSIGRATARLLRSIGMSVRLVGRTSRPGGPQHGPIHAASELASLLPDTDWLLLIVPLTAESRGLIGADELGLLPRAARVVNIGRGPVIVETALLDSLRSGHLAGAALDVFEEEPLPADHAFWSMPNVIVSPHIGGDVEDTPAALTRSFLANLERYVAGQPLHDVIDKRLGYVPTGQR